MPRTKVVVIVKQCADEEYVRALVRLLEQSSVDSQKTEPSAPNCRVETVETCDDALKRIETCDVDVLIFCSSMFTENANSIKADIRFRFDLKVIILTSLIPRSYPITLERKWVDLNTAAKLLL